VAEDPQTRDVLRELLRRPATEVDPGEERFWSRWNDYASGFSGKAT